MLSVLISTHLHASIYQDYLQVFLWIIYGGVIELLKWINFFT
jgi:hypothetical protein